MSSGPSVINGLRKPLPEEILGETRAQDEEISKIAEELQAIARERIDLNQEAAAKSTRIEELAEEIREMQAGTRQLIIDIDQVKNAKKKSEQEATCNKVGNIICGVFFVAIIATGVIVITLRYA